LLGKRHDVIHLELAERFSANGTQSVLQNPQKITLSLAGDSFHAKGS
jgi:hypothetical protein